MVEQEIEEEDGLTTPASISNIEVFHELDLDSDDEVSVIEWSLEGGSVSDFWALLTRHDNNGKSLSRVKKSFRKLSQWNSLFVV